MAIKKLGGATNARENALLESVQSRPEIDISKTVVTTAEHIAVAEREKRTARIQGMLTPSEKEAFISAIGRMSESDAIRELVLYMLNKPTNKPKLRQEILNLIKKNNV